MDYVLPLKTAPDSDVSELGEYVRRISAAVQVIVVDGSAPEQFAANRRHFAGVKHVRPDPQYTFANGKVRGVCTGWQLCASDRVVIADDDVRYELAELARMQALLEDHDLVRPQNYFRPAPWHAQWDTARSLLNRSLGGGDFPGTLGLRLTDALRNSGYDGDVLFENLELIRTVRAAGGRELVADVYVRRLPPTARHFAGQRLRQAYDSQAQPLRLLAELALLPAIGWASRRPARLLAGVIAGIGLAEVGRRRDGGGAYFSRRAPLFAPVWVAERAVCVWGALWLRVARGGVSYSGQRLKRAAHSERWLRRQRTADGPS
jgi:hypothetical protein